MINKENNQRTAFTDSFLEGEYSLNDWDIFPYSGKWPSLSFPDAEDAPKVSRVEGSQTVSAMVAGDKMILETAQHRLIACRRPYS